ncbi:MAG: carbohydrate kinase [Desulfurococcaceae archaeon]
MYVTEATCMGEILVDIIPLEPGGYKDGAIFEVHFGGAPANVAVGIARLNHRSAFIGSIGDDPFGDMLKDFLVKNGVDTRWLVRKKARTSLAFVMLHENGERDFFFYREPWVKTADTMLKIDDIDLDDVLKTKVIHISGVATAYPSLNETIYEVMKEAYRSGVFVSIDPNYRADIWGSGELALKTMNKYFRVSHMITMGKDELLNMFGIEDHKYLARMIFDQYPNIEIVALRLGALGAYVAKRNDEEIYVPAYKITPVDTTGAGDVWTATFIVMHILEGMKLEKSIKYANAAAAIKCTRRGAVTAFPRRDEIENFIKQYESCC